MAKEAPQDMTIGLASETQLACEWQGGDLELSDPAEEPDPADLQQSAETAEAAALSVEGVSMVQSASAGYGRHIIQLATSNGFSGTYSRTSNGLSCVAITGNGTGMERDYFGESRVFRNELPSAQDVGRIAGLRTVERAGARKPATGKFPVLFDERVAASLVGHLLMATNGTSIVRGSSWARGLLGKKVLPDQITLTENPHRPRVSGSRPFDGEGLQTAPRKIVENGILMGWTTDLSTARKLGVESTANAARGTSAPPSPSISNVTLTQGVRSRDALIRDMGTGLVVTSMIGSSINPTTGDYSRGASGFWVENGEIAYPVNECTIAGNLLEMLLSIVPANDARNYLSRVVPSLLVEGLTLAGE